MGQRRMAANGCRTPNLDIGNASTLADLTFIQELRTPRSEKRPQFASPRSYRSPRPSSTGGRGSKAKTKVRGRPPRLSSTSLLRSPLNLKKKKRAHLRGRL